MNNSSENSRADSDPLGETMGSDNAGSAADTPTTDGSNSDDFSHDATSRTSPSPTKKTKATSVRAGGGSERLAYKIGARIENRYEIMEKLGRGGFGTVFRALDSDLNRVVAIKQSTGLRSFVAGRVRDEAKAVASLNHPGIVAIFDLITVSESELLIVMECLDGQTLTKYLQSRALSSKEVVQICLQVCEALKHAHERKLVHSDLKPSNLFVTNDGAIKLLDFGLAVAHFPDASGGSLGGTPGYMAPEQIRGESHRIDGRADIWAFGVILYQMLTGTRPFVGKNQRAVIEATIRKEVPPPRQLNSDVDTELQRIVLRCLEKRMVDRYDSCVELQEDLQAWLDTTDASSESALLKAAIAEPESRGSSSLRIKTRGLQPFTEDDSESYLALVPGPRDRHGVPDSINFWRNWVASNDPTSDYPVGVLYGPSGSGKTSYVRAGLLPNLPGRVCAVYVECRPGDLAQRITRIIETRLQDDSTGSSLRDVLTRIRSDESSTSQFSKILIVLDQFEAWSHRATIQDRRNLADALRQCDGTRIRALVVIRDDFWMGATELLRWLELPLQEGRNIGSVDLIDPQHASRILEATGRSLGTLPPDPEPLTKEQDTFIDQAVSELTTGSAIIAVHLVMFAQMIRFQEWTPKSLRGAGGVSGACSLFFQELFQPNGTATTSSPEYRRISPAAKPMLSALLPVGSVSVTAMTKSHSELKEVVKVAGSESLLDDTLRILISDLGMVTVVSNDEKDNQDEPHYRLAHDFLVDPIRAWVNRDNNRTMKGRASSTLVEMSDAWNRRPSEAQMPAYGQFLYLSAFSPMITKTDQQRTYLRAARRHHAGRISATALAFLAFIGMSIVAWNQRKNAVIARQDAFMARQAEIATKVDLMLHGPPTEIQRYTEDLLEFGDDAQTALKPWSESPDDETRLRANVVLASQNESFQILADGLEVAPYEFFDLMLSNAKKKSDAKTILNKLALSKNTKVRSRAAILLVYLDDTGPVEQILKGSINADNDTGFFLEFSRWRGAPEPWIQLFQTLTDAQQRYHAGVCLASYPKEQLTAADIDYTELINHPKAALRQIGVFLAAHMDVEMSEANTPPGDADWVLTPSNIPMVKIPAGNYSYFRLLSPSKTMDKCVLKRSIWYSANAIPRSLYKEFVNDISTLLDGSMPRVKVSHRSQDEFPNVQNEPITLIDAAHAHTFCNWLSEKEGLVPAYAFDSKLAKERTSDGRFRYPYLPIWDASGYRLPTWWEFNAAARGRYIMGIGWAHAETIATAGGDDKLRVKGNDHIRPFRSLIPNRFGIFTNDPFCGSWLTGNDNLCTTAVAKTATKVDMYHGSYDPVGALRYSAYASLFVVKNQTTTQK